MTRQQSWAFDQIRQMHNLILANIQSLFTLCGTLEQLLHDNKTSIVFLFENIVKKSKTFRVKKIYVCFWLHEILRYGW